MVCLFAVFYVVLDHCLYRLVFLHIVFCEGVPQLVGEIVAKLLVELGPH